VLTTPPLLPSSPTTVGREFRWCAEVTRQSLLKLVIATMYVVAVTSCVASPVAQSGDESADLSNEWTGDYANDMYRCKQLIEQTINDRIRPWYPHQALAGTDLLAQALDECPEPEPAEILDDVENASESD
jgi:hypothetical protein